MPGWKPDCLKASSTLNHLSSTIETARFINGRILDYCRKIEIFCLILKLNYQKKTITKITASQTSQPLSNPTIYKTLTIIKIKNSIWVIRQNHFRFKMLRLNFQVTFLILNLLFFSSNCIWLLSYKLLLLLFPFFINANHFFFLE